MRRTVAILLTAIVLVAMGTGLWHYLRPRATGADLALVRADGEVELRGPGRGGAAAIGTPLRVADQIVTGDGRAVLELGGGSRVRIGPTSSVLIQGVAEMGVQLALDGGAVEATVRPGSGSVAVSGAGVTAQATDADFRFGLRDDIAIVSADRGDVALMGADVARVTAGSRAVIQGRAAAVGPAPDDLLLDVRWPAVTRTRHPTSRLEGRTSPAATVTASGRFGARETVADADGAFAFDLPLEEGDNAVQLEAVDVFGERARVDGQLQRRATRVPAIRGGVEYGN